MRQLKNIWLMIIILISVTACDFLDEDPKTFPVVENKYRTTKDFEIALVGAYEMLGSTKIPNINISGDFGNYRYGMLVIGECGTDEICVKNAQRQEELNVDSYAIYPTERPVQALWAMMYQGVSRCNAIISKAPVTDTTEIGNIKSIVAEAKFLRALYYFNLTRIFGGVPCIEVPLTATTWKEVTKRDSISKVYRLIIDDLNFASQNLQPSPRNNETGRATSVAAFGLLSRVYLHAASMKNTANIPTEIQLNGINSYEWVELNRNDSNYYQLCINNCDSVFKHFNLSDPLNGISYSSNFWPNKNGRESLFEVQFSTAYSVDVTGQIGNAFGVEGLLDNGRNWLRALATEYFNTCDKEDSRFKWNVANYRYDASGTKITNTVPKYWGFMKYNNDFSISATRSTPGKTPQNWIVLRLAEVCLNYAESKAELYNLTNNQLYLDESITMLNCVRRRARGSASSSVLPNIDIAFVLNPLKTDGSQEELNEIYKILKPISGIISIVAPDGNEVQSITIEHGELDSPIKRMRALLLNERKWEFIGEGHRWFDLVRTGYFKKILDGIDNMFDAAGSHPDELKKPRNVKPYYIFRPLPARETEFGFEQNYGYN